MYKNDQNIIANCLVYSTDSLGKVTNTFDPVTYASIRERLTWQACGSAKVFLFL